MQENGTSVLGLAVWDLQVSGMAQCIVRNTGHIHENEGNVGPWSELLHVGPCTLHHGNGVGGGDHPPPFWRSY
jgi:hypothetical protein